jgi:hypothetical protein
MTVTVRPMPDDARAQNLYRSLDYRVTAITMSKDP